MGPLSAKQHREYLKFSAQEARETAKMEREEARKQQLHNIKLVEAAGKAGQTLGHKEDVHKYKMGTLGAPLKAKTPNPLAGTDIFKRGQHMLPFQVEDAAKARKAAKQNTDTVPAMLTPGEAVIPAPAAQDPKNKPIIKKMVQQGRQANKRGYADGTLDVNIDTDGIENVARELAQQYLRDGSVNISNSDVIPSRVQQAAGYNEGTIQVPVPSLAYEHSDVPGSSFADGTERVYDFKRGSSASYHFEDGTLEVPTEQMYANVVEQALPSPVVEQPPVPVVAAAPTQDVVFALPAEQVVKSNVNNPNLTVAQRNNNPGNLIFIGQPGAVKGDQRPDGTYWAKFENPETGRTALENQLRLDTQRRGMNLTDTMNKYAPKADKNNTQAYIDYISKATGIKPNEKVPPEKLVEVADAIQYYESGGRYTKNNKPIPSNIPRSVPVTGSTNAIVLNPTDRPRTQQESDALFDKQKSDVKNWVNKTFDTNVPKPNREASGKVIDMRPRDEVGELLVPVPRTIAQDNPPVVIPKSMRNLEETSPGSGQQTIKEANPPVVIPENMKDLEGEVQVSPEEKNKIVSLFSEDKDKAIANIARDNALEIERLRNKVTSEESDPEKQKSMLAKAIEFIYGGPDSMFNDKDLARFAVVAAGGLLTGGSVNGSLRYASRDTLQSSDARRSAEAAQASKIDSEDRDYKRQVELKNIELGVTNVKERQKETKAYFNKTIDDYEKEGRLTPANATLLRKAVYSGNYNIVEKALDDPGTYGTDLYNVGLKPDAKPVTIVEEGYTTGRPAYKDNSGNYIVFDTDAKGAKTPRVISGKNQREVGDTTNVATQNENRFKDNLLASQYFRQDKKTGATPFDLSFQEVISQLNVWQQEQRRLGLPDDYSRFSDQINDGLNRALKSGEKKPNITKMLHLATINTSVLTDENKMTVNNNQLDSKSNGKSIPTSKIGEMVQDIRKHNSPKEKYKNNVDEYKAQSNQSTKFLDKVSTEYEQMKQEEGFTPNALAEKARSKKIDDKLINKIREAPNPYWALVYYRMAVPIKD